jgi:hypothetical protein
MTVGMLGPAALEGMYLKDGNKSASEIANGLAMGVVRSENRTPGRGLLMGRDAVLAEERDSVGAPVVASLLASHCSCEIAGLPEAGIASVVRLLAYRCQCPY